MFKTELSLSDVFDYFKEHQIKSFEDDIDEYGGFFITASTIAAIIISPDPISKIAAFTTGVGVGSFKVSTLLSWLPDKFKYREKGRELIAIKRYELSAHINFILLQIAIKQAIKDVIFPYIELVLREISLDNEQKSELKRQCEAVDAERMNLAISSIDSFKNASMSAHALKLVDVLLSFLYKELERCKEDVEAKKKLNSTRVRDEYLEKVRLNYQAFLIHCSTEFPEFSLWVNIENNAKILKELKSSFRKVTTENKKVSKEILRTTERMMRLIEELHDKSFKAEAGFPTFLANYSSVFKIHDSSLQSTSSGRIIENIVAHQSEIKREVNKPLSDNTDVEYIVYPKSNEIYISQGFEAITYRRKEHRKGFLTAGAIGDNPEKGENIGNYLLQCLAEPVFIHRPIVLLGNPGAGKSMLSKMFAAKLCETNDYIPFLVKLRTVASSSTSISEHINKGLANSIENTSDINWLDWAKEFRERMPVIIMDGFDELMQTSNRELNGYIEAIRDFQEKAVSNGVCVRIILTSRITVMQDVAIPEGTKVIKLDSFDDKRVALWIKKWNEAQGRGDYTFNLPTNDKILALAREPLLIFMLAVFDFERSELQNMANDRTFNQSKLYDSLLNKFIKRQLEKDDRYKNTSSLNQSNEENLFRLRLGMIALMMFLSDTTSRDTQKLQEEMSAFGLGNSQYQGDNVIGGFFFIHENKSVTDSNIEKFNYEFLHKTFGEFLTADFLLRVAARQYSRIIDNSDDIISRKDVFQFAFGYNWLNKHHNILNFLFEHGRQIFSENSSQQKVVINSIIKGDLKEVFDKLHLDFPSTTIRLLEKKSVMEHLGIYSQNLIFLWLAIGGAGKRISFQLFDQTAGVADVASEAKYESQDREEFDRNKYYWKRISRLWTITGNHQAAAKLKEWIEVDDSVEGIFLKAQKGEVIHNFSDAAFVCCNDFEWLLSYFDNEYKLSPDSNFLNRVSSIVDVKPELTVLAVDVVLHRLVDVFTASGAVVFEFVNMRVLTPRQQAIYIRKIAELRSRRNPMQVDHVLSDHLFAIHTMVLENPFAAIEYIKLVADVRSVSLLKVIPIDSLENMLYRISGDLSRISFENPYAAIEFLRVLRRLNRSNFLRWRIRGDFFDEIFFRVSSDLPRYLDSAPHVSFEYLKLMLELAKYHPVGRRVGRGLLEEMAMRLPQDIGSSIPNTPEAVLEYLRLIVELRSHWQIRGRDFQQFVGEALNTLSINWSDFLAMRHYNSYDCLKTFADLIDLVDIQKYLAKNQIEALVVRVLDDMIFLIRDNGRVAGEYLRFLRRFRQFLPTSFERGKNEENITSEVFRRLESITMMDRRIPTRIFFIYFELLLMISNVSSFQRVEHLLVQIQRRRKTLPVEQSFIFKMTALLINYRVPKVFITPLLLETPELLNIYSSSPLAAEKIILAHTELIEYERRDKSNYFRGSDFDRL